MNNNYEDISDRELEDIILSVCNDVEHGKVARALLDKQHRNYAEALAAYRVAKVRTEAEHMRRTFNSYSEQDEALAWDGIADAIALRTLESFVPTCICPPEIRIENATAEFRAEAELMSPPEVRVENATSGLMLPIAILGLALIIIPSMLAFIFGA